MVRQCLNSRIDFVQNIAQKVATWQADRSYWKRKWIGSSPLKMRVLSENKLIRMQTINKSMVLLHQTDNFCSN